MKKLTPEQRSEVARKAARAAREEGLIAMVRRLPLRLIRLDFQRVDHLGASLAVASGVVVSQPKLSVC